MNTSASRLNSKKQKLSFKRLGNILAASIILLGVMYISVLSYSLNQIQTLQQSWTTFEHARSEKIRANIALHRELGYGGLIHDFKNLILRQDEQLLLSLQAHWGAASATIRHYETLDLSEAEINALSDIERVIDNYRSTARTIGRLIAANTPVSEIVERVNINDAPALAGFKILDVYGIDSAEAINGYGKPAILNKLRKVLGYGGYINNFKDYVLTHNDKHRIAVKEQYQIAMELLDQYEQRKISIAEKHALNEIRRTINEYQGHLENIKSLISLGFSAFAIDKSVRVDDTPALAAFIGLDKEIVLEGNKRAKKMHAIFESMRDVLFSIILVSIAVICVFVILSVRLIRKQILHPVTLIISQMSRLAKGDVAKQDRKPSSVREIEEMGDALEVFRRNITERMAAETALLSREELLNAIFDTVPDVIVTIDSNWVIKTTNDALEKVFGYKKQEMIESVVMSLFDKFPVNDLDNTHCTVQDFIDSSDQGTWHSAQGVRKDQSTCPIEFAISPTSTKATGHFTMVLRDITEREEIETMKSQFISTVSHELRTPLTSIQGSLGLLRAMGKNLTEADVELLDIATRNGERLINLVNDILTISKMDSADFELHKTDFDFTVLAKQCAQDINGFAVTHDVEVELTGLSEPILMHGDYERLLQVMVNLLSNAIKYSEPKGTVTINLLLRKNQCRVEVIDSGRGIPKEFGDQIFNRFAQADGSDDRDKGGTGLGLNISKRIVELHDGQIGFESELGSGSVFYFEIPTLK